MGEGQESGIVDRTKEDGLPGVYKFVDESPSQETRDSYSWLTVISWKYDRDVRKGMPPENVNKQMIALEHAIDELEDAELCRHAIVERGTASKS
jgi:hypothetical protein